MDPGLHGLSNGLLDEPWPKVARGKANLDRALGREAGLEGLLDVVNDRHQPADSELPDTGVSRELERLVAPVFIQSDQYGTRASSAVQLHDDGHIEMAEQSWQPNGQPDGPVRYSQAL